jgi:hypothetical protein
MKDRARILFALLAGLIFILLKVLFPALPFTEEQTLLFIGMIGAYILGEGLEGQRLKDNLMLALRSNKLQALVAGSILVLVKSFFPTFPITEAQLTELISILSLLILGAGVQGAVSNANTKG